MTRRPFDFYETTGELVDALMGMVSIPANATIVEPCNGHGAISKRIGALRRDVTVRTYDIDPEKAPHVADARTLVYPNDARIVITNPPFDGAFPILVNAMQQGLDVAFLLRLSFLEPTVERGDWLRDHPPQALIVCPRTSFTADGKTDSVTCAWMVWTSREPSLYVRPGIHVALTPSWYNKLERETARRIKRNSRST